MKILAALMLALPAYIILFPPPVQARCTVCHSKNPKMVRMHEALEFKECFQCHGPTAKKSSLPVQEQMAADDRCVRCHGTGKAPASAPRNPDPGKPEQ